jgi:hypothetical protein
MAGVYRPRHPERTVLYRVLSHHFDGFLAAYEDRFEREYRYFRPVVKEVVERYLEPHLHFLVTEGGMDARGDFQAIPRIDDSRLAELFAREVLAMLVRKELLSPDWAERILSWPHTGFNVHSLVRTQTKIEAERVGKYMIRPLLSLERLSFLEPEGKVGYRHGQGSASQSSMRLPNKGTTEQETMDYLEFIARVTSNI